VNSTKKTARLVGALYVLVLITGVFGLIYVPGKLFVVGDATATIGNILSSESLFRLYIVNGIVSPVIFMFVVLALYQLFKDVNHTLARVMVILVLIQVPMGLVGTLNQIAVLELARGVDYLSLFSRAQLEGLAMFCLHLDDQLTLAYELFWGLWLFPLGWMVIKSRFMPRFIGVWLLLNGAAYVLTFLIGFLLPAYLDITSKVMFPLLMGEVVFSFWLMIRGIKTPAETGPMPADTP
jgi:hypothetical protein